jgi:hypothetical protein
MSGSGMGVVLAALAAALVPLLWAALVRQVWRPYAVARAFARQCWDQELRRGVPARARHRQVVTAHTKTPKHERNRESSRKKMNTRYFSHCNRSA